MPDSENIAFILIIKVLIYKIKFIYFIRIEVLNLANNLLTDLCSAEIKRFLIENNNLEELILRWNNFTSFGGKQIVNGLLNNSILTIFDISHNNLGIHRKVI